MPFFGFGSSGSGSSGSGSMGYGSSYINKPERSDKNMERDLIFMKNGLEEDLQTPGAKLGFFVDKVKTPTLYKAAEAIIAKGGMRSRTRRNSKTRKARSSKSKTPRKDKQ